MLYVVARKMVNGLNICDLPLTSLPLTSLPLHCPLNTLVESSHDLNVTSAQKSDKHLILYTGFNLGLQLVLGIIN